MRQLSVPGPFHREEATVTVHTGAKTISRVVGRMLDNVFQLQHIMAFSVAAPSATRRRFVKITMQAS
ncbi:hypothetical protein FOMG_16470 [Fusarium oxysporum f. sp. melonis 26406]|uniref:Uncharacterized protein n=1 Tax=Fusarium oxysporum f. sp. melonis 26406 TaxID=1089452 RepID=W9ZES4_FUSOX|nr:hypothetical protein FOMG_16470 [Fusarium oxysporum f. sp. melonis 26406]